MKKLMTLAMIAFFGLMISGVVHADAKRFGMGSSFGKQRMFQPKSNNFSQRQATPSKSKATGSQRGSARTGMMGMIGGLALGGMLGAMFFGGAFEGINFFDILIIGGIIALVFMFLRKKAPARQSNYATASASPSNHDFAQDFSSSDGDADIVDHEPREPIGTALRPDINEKTFIPAAKEIYIRMQQAWDSGDIDDIRKFCTAEISDRISQDMKSSTAEHRTEVATLNAEIADSWMESDLEWVAVNYTAMLREQSMDDHQLSDGNTTEVNEVWIFQHAPKSNDPIWYLAGIQQAS
jgi:predicted lipid-binding transport protein (Tim44 family)